MKVGDKVVRVGSNSPSDKSVVSAKHWVRKCPKFNTVYVVSDAWDTSLGRQIMLIGFGPAPIINGYKTGWLAKHFRLLDEVRKESALKKSVGQFAAPMTNPFPVPTPAIQPVEKR